MDKKDLTSDNEEFDEVSLPGVGDNEQPTILEVLNRGIVNTEDGTGGSSSSSGGTGKEERQSGDTVNTIKVTSTLEDDELRNSKNDQESDILVSSSRGEWNEEPQRSQLVAEDEENVFDIESHLIETLNNYSVSEDSEWGVDIKELPPAEGESLYRTSKIETDPLIGTVFEVEPATPRVLKPVETSLPEPLKQSGLAHKAQEERRSPAVEVQSTNESQTPAEEGVIEQKPAQKTAPKAEETSETKAAWEIVKELQRDLETSTRNVDASPEDSSTAVKQDSEKVDTDPAVRRPKELSKTDRATPESEDRVDSKLKGSSTQEESNKAEVDFTTLEPKDRVDSKLKGANTSAQQESSKTKAESKDRVDSKLKEANTSAQEESKAQSKDRVDSKLKGSDTQEESKKAEADLATPEPTDRVDSKLKNSSTPAEKESNKAETDPNTLKEESSKVDLKQTKDRVEPIETVTVEYVKLPTADDSRKEENSTSDCVDSSSAQDKTLSRPIETAVFDVKPEAVQEDTDIDAEADTQAKTQSGDTNSAQKPHPDTHDNVETTNDKKPSIEATKTDKEPTAPDPKAANQDSDPRVTIEKSNDDTKTDLPPAGVKEESSSLTAEIDQKLSELATHLTKSSKVDLNGNVPKLEGQSLESAEDSNVDVNGLPLPQTAQEEEQRQQFLDSLPQISPETDANKAAALAKREYYQSLRQYLITHSDKPPIPPETYRWEDLRRAKQRGGYPWTHLYKRPLGPDEEPEIVLLLRKSQELRFASESPKSFKKVRIDDQVSIKETERYIQELSDTEENPPTEDEEQEEQEDARSECISCVSDSVLTVEKRASKLGKLRGILKKRGPRKEQDAASLPDTLTTPSRSLPLNHKSEEDIRDRPSRPIKEAHNKAKCFPIMKKLRSMADRQKKNFQNIKKISLKKDEKISLEEEQKIIKLKTSPKAERSEIPHFIEKQDSDDVLEIVELDESPSRKRKDQLELQEQAAAAAAAAESTVVEPDEIIEIPKIVENDSSERQQTPEPTVSEILEEELKSEALEPPPKKTARLRREHVYEDIESANDEVVSDEINKILEIASVEALKQSLASQDTSAMKDVEATKTALPLERMGSSEEEVERSHLAPLSSIDSASSDDERKPHLSTVTEESDGVTSDKEEPERQLETVPEVEVKETEHIPWNDIELKPALKKEASPSPSEKKVTFSHVEDEAEPHREDIELPEGLAGIGSNRWSNLR